MILLSGNKNAAEVTQKPFFFHLTVKDGRRRSKGRHEIVTIFDDTNLRLTVLLQAFGIASI
jgi:hypothetical protein